MHSFVTKYSRLAQENELQGKINAELEAQCDQLRSAHAQLEEHNVTLAAALKVR